LKASKVRVRVLPRESRGTVLVKIERQQSKEDNSIVYSDSRATIATAYNTKKPRLPIKII